MSGPHTSMLSVYSGQRCLGHIITRGKRGFEACDRDDNSLGTPTQPTSMETIR